MNMKSKVAPGESDTNQSAHRLNWEQSHHGDAAKHLLERDRQRFLHQSVSTPCLGTIRSAEGIWIEDLAGNRFMDFHGNNVHHIGYGHPRLVESIEKQMKELPFAPRRFTCEVAVQLAEKLAEITPGSLGKTLFTTSGSAAVEVALAYARAVTGRFKTISFWDSFHGAGFAARGIGGEEMFRSGPIGPLMPGTEHVPPFGDYRNAWGVTEGSAELCAKQIEYVLEKEGDVGALIAEPTRAVPCIPDAGFWRRVKTACEAKGTLLIFDEIPTGLGKTGRMFSCEHEGVVPDILVVGKGLGGGILPIAATVCRPELDVCQDYAFGHYTHEKNPVTSRAALTTIEIIEQEGLVENASRVGELALTRLYEMQNQFEAIGDVRGRGCLFGIEMVVDRQSREPANDLAERILYQSLGRGLSFKTTMGNVLTFSPPLVTSEDQMNDAMDILQNSIVAALESVQ